MVYRRPTVGLYVLFFKFFIKGILLLASRKHGSTGVRITDS